MSRVMVGRSIDAEVAIGLVKSVARGLGEAHSHGIVHRDIKPANILITPELVPKLGDFGLAVPDSDVGSGLVMGTPGFLAPEVMDDPMAAGFSSDTFALGVILYELLTGQSVEGGVAVDMDLDLDKIETVSSRESEVIEEKPKEEVVEYLKINNVEVRLDNIISIIEE